MSVESSAKGLLAAVTVAFLVVAVAMPLMGGHESPLSSEENSPDYRLSARAGYEATIEIASCEPAGVPLTAYEVTEGEESRTVELQGPETALWAYDGSPVVLTSAGILAPGLAEGRVSEVGSSVAFSSGTVTLGASTASFDSVLAPDGAGTLGHYSGPFSVSGLGAVLYYNAYGGQWGTSSGAPGWAVEKSQGAGYTVVEAATDSDGQAALGFVAPIGYAAADEGDTLVSEIVGAAPLILLAAALVFGGAAIVGRRRRWRRGTSS